MLGPGGGAEEGEQGVGVKWGQSLSLGRWKIRETDDGESRTTGWMYLVPLNWTLNYGSNSTFCIMWLLPQLKKKCFKKQRQPEDCLVTVMVPWRGSWNSKQAWVGDKETLVKYLVQFSCSVVSDSLQPRRLQHARRPCPSPSPMLADDSASILAHQLWQRCHGEVRRWQWAKRVTGYTGAHWAIFATFL